MRNPPTKPAIELSAPQWPPVPSYECVRDQHRTSQLHRLRLLQTQSPGTLLRQVRSLHGTAVQDLQIRFEQLPQNKNSYLLQESYRCIASTNSRTDCTPAPGPLFPVNAPLRPSIVSPAKKLPQPMAVAPSTCVGAQRRTNPLAQDRPTRTQMLSTSPSSREVGCFEHHFGNVESTP